MRSSNYRELLSVLSSHLPLGDFDESPCLLPGFPYLPATLLTRIDAIFNALCLSLVSLLCVFEAPLCNPPTPGSCHRD